MTMSKLKEVKFIAVHCAATKVNQDVTVEDLRHWHVDQNGWDDIGYHHFIKFNGMVYECRSNEYAGAHCPDINKTSIAICIEGGFGGVNNFTKVQLRHLMRVIEQLKKSYPNAAVVGHSHFSDKACPVINVVEMWEYYLKTGEVKE